MLKLNEDWDRFDTILRAELKKLGATEQETEAILQGAWDAATEVDDIARFAADEIELVRAF